MLADDLDHISNRKFCMNRAVPSLLEGNLQAVGPRRALRQP